MSIPTKKQKAKLEVCLYDLQKTLKSGTGTKFLKEFIKNNYDKVVFERYMLLLDLLGVCIYITKKKSFVAAFVSDADKFDRAKIMAETLKGQSAADYVITINGNQIATMLSTTDIKELCKVAAEVFEVNTANGSRLYNIYKPFSDALLDEIAKPKIR